MVRVSFTDLRDSEKAFSTIQVRHATWRLARLSPKALSSSNDVALVSNFEGQVLVSVYFDGRDSSIQAHASYNALMETLGTFGNIKAFRSVRCQEQGNLREIRVEYYNSRNADLACRSLQKILVGVSTQVLSFIDTQLTYTRSSASNDLCRPIHARHWTPCTRDY